MKKESTKKTACKPPKRAAKAPAEAKPPEWKAEKLEALIDEATVDANDEDEQLMGFDSCLQDEVKVPFETVVLGDVVTVESVGLNDANEMVATIRKGKHTQDVALVDLPLPMPPPKGAEWIAAYCLWRKNS